MSTTRDITQRRRRPVQRRSRETFDRICAAATEILIEQGLESLNTNAVAERAGVSITAVYAYFPDKFAILHELFLRSEERWRAAVAPTRERLWLADDYPSHFREMTLVGAKARIDDPEYRALRAAVWAVPELAVLQEEALTEYSERLAEALRQGNPGLTRKQAQKAARVLVVSSNAVVDDCTRTGQVDRALLDQAVRMTELYLVDILGL